MVEKTNKIPIACTKAGGVGIACHMEFRPLIERLGRVVEEKEQVAEVCRGFKEIYEKIIFPAVVDIQPNIRQSAIDLRRSIDRYWFETLHLPNVPSVAKYRFLVHFLLFYRWRNLEKFGVDENMAKRLVRMLKLAFHHTRPKPVVIPPNHRAF